MLEAILYSAGTGENVMSCQCAHFDADEGRYFCDVSGDQCMFFIPSSKACAKMYGEGPDVGNEESEAEHDQT